MCHANINKKRIDVIILIYKIGFSQKSLQETKMNYKLIKCEFINCKNICIKKQCPKICEAIIDRIEER